MENILSGLIAPFLLCIALILVPVTDITLQADRVSQNVVDNAVQEFVDNARSSGKITHVEYEQLMGRVNAALPLSDVSILYGEKSAVPGDEPQTYEVYHEHVPMEAILDTLYPDVGSYGDFLMKDGDYLSVTVKNTTDTLGTKLLSIFLSRAAGSTSVYSVYGGYVRENGFYNR